MIIVFQQNVEDRFLGHSGPRILDIVNPFWTFADPRSFFPLPICGLLVDLSFEFGIE